MDYPRAHRSETAVDFFGVRVPDPYRWLEDQDDEATKRFIDEQNALSRPQLASLPERPAMLRRVREAVNVPQLTLPRVHGGVWLAESNDGEANQSSIVVADSLDDLAERPRVLFDPNVESSDGTLAVSVAQLSPDGRFALIALSDGGSDWHTLRVLDTATGERVGDDVEWVKFSAGSWLPDASGFVYKRYDTPDGNAMSERNGEFDVRVRSLDGADELLYREDDGDKSSWLTVRGSLLVRSEGRMGERARDIFVHRIAAGRHISGGAVHLSHTDGPDEWVAGVDGETVYLASLAEAPRGRVVAIDLAGVSEGTKAPAGRVVVPEADGVLVHADLAARAIVTSHLRDASSVVHAYPLASAGEDASGQAIALDEGAFSVLDVAADPERDEVLVRTGSFTSPGRNWIIDTGTAPAVAREIASTPAGATQPAQSGASVSRMSATSADGAEVRAFVVRPAGLGEGPQPTLIWGYGGFNIAVEPGYRAIFAAWVAAGGTLVVANLRGGGEQGDAWYEQGTKLQKQNVFNDLYALAEQLIADGVTSPSQLAVHGRSNGGLLAGAALTQRPDLWAAALPTVGVLDMLRFHRFTIGWAWTRDYGSTEHEDEFRALYAYSPLHNVRPGVEYPPTLITTGDRDDRVVPAHSLKFAAELQHTSTSKHPVLLRVDTRAGHGAGKPRDAQVDEFADQLAFAAHYTGLDPR